MYDLMWFCNIIMFINALGLYLRNPIMIAATINMIYMDQVKFKITIFHLF
jgi:hypothetical protein